MGFYFRKSIKLGPVRLNFSKSGIGVSTGVKGIRYSVGPRGTFFQMGRKGLYYRQQISSPKTIMRTKQSSIGSEPSSNLEEQMPCKNTSENSSVQPLPQVEPVVLEGNGDQATKTFALRSGLAIIRYSLKGNVGGFSSIPSNFIVDLLTPSGECVATVVNTIKEELNGSQAVPITASRNYLINVQAAGQWKVIVTQEQ